MWFLMILEALLGRPVARARGARNAQEAVAIGTGCTATSQVFPARLRACDALAVCMESGAAGG